jgi:hypothetical protein
MLHYQRYVIDAYLSLSYKERFFLGGGGEFLTTQQATYEAV